MVKFFKFYFIFVLSFLFVGLKGQQPILTNNHATFYCATGSITWVHGSVNNIGDSLYNLGYMGIVGDLQNDGKISGNGIYEIGSHWINNNNFKCGLSKVIMNNTIYSPLPLVPDQLITGSVHTKFYDLTLTGVGVKSITFNDTVTHYLDLTDRELAVNNHTMYVVNTDPLAIKRTAGFVSNLSNGWLSRTTNVVGSYLFPVGSASSVTRYRPVEITTVNNTLSEYIVGFFNYNATIDGFNVHSKDSTICLVDSLFYHKIDRTFGHDTVNMTVFYDHLTDGPWNGLANWNMLGASQWNNMRPVSQLYSPMWGIHKSMWSNWTNEPYALIAKVPDSVTIDGPASFCIGSGIVTYNAWGEPYEEYIWNVYGGHIIGDSTHNSIQVLWTQPGVGIVTVQEISSFGKCISYMSHFFVNVYPEPIADFVIELTDTTYIYTYDLFHFVDSSINAVQWHWDFGDATTSSLQNPYHVYENPGIYTVCLLISSQDNCIDDTCKIVVIEEGLVVPNIFTPNGDGHNDVFDILASGIIEFYLQIYNRWGILIFESESPYVKWDGRTISGEEASEGTYYYILNAKSAKKDYSRHGIVTLLR